MFGRSVPAELVKEKGRPARYWGARAIFRAGQIDLLPDRQSCDCGDLDPQPLLDWINKVGFPELKKQRAFKTLSSDSDEVVEVRDKQFTLQASPQRSYGYLYIGVWQYWAEGCKYNQKQPDPSAKWTSPTFPVPAIGDEVVVAINGRWEGKVASYFVEHGYQGIEVACSVRPDWKVKQAPDDKLCLFCGLELKEVKTPAGVS
jgi:hypothetical protein